MYLFGCKSFFLMFIYFERETENMSRGETERETRNPKQTPGSKLSAQSLMQGSNSQTMRLWPEPKSDAHQTKSPRCPILGFLLLGVGFLITDLISLLISLCILLISLFRFSIHDSDLVGCLFLGIYPFLLGYPICWCIIVHSSLIYSFVFLWYQL